ncbi:MAG: hypothetical protein IM627_18315 [Cytophagales bacterium]|nr:hypothetical protein [Cytophagales bacterium]
MAKNYKERYERLLAEHKTKGVAKYEASFFEILMHASQGTVEALYVQTYVSETIKKLKTILNDNELNLIGNSVSGLITNLDMKYYNFLGELSTLVIIKEHLRWTLTATEIEDGPGKPIDFEFQNERRKIKVEVMNIHLTKEVEEVDESISKFLTKRITDKQADKTREHLIKIDFLTAPVIWGPVNELKKISNYLKRNPWTITGALKPTAFVNFRDEHSGRMFQKFKDLESIFD